MPNTLEMDQAFGNLALVEPLMLDIHLMVVVFVVVVDIDCNQRLVGVHNCSHTDEDTSMMSSMMAVVNMHLFEAVSNHSMGFQVV